jgi:1-pyrroline-5-carboxylate dehydrogenase
VVVGVITRLADAASWIARDSRYALTGAVFARERSVIDALSQSLRDAAGNLYLNDKPTGAVVGQQPFVGARVEREQQGRFDVDLVRWVSPRTIKETFVPPREVAYPHMAGDGLA